MKERNKENHKELRREETGRKDSTGTAVPF
jgi:hypothetical protein